MSGAKLLQPTLTAGEVAPALYARVDINRYAAGLRRCRNFIVRPYGGVENRPGFRFIAETPDVIRHRLIPFVFSDGVSYVLQFGAGYFRVLSYGAPVTPSSTAYAGGTTYVLGDYVTSAGILYRSLQAGNVGHTPASSPTWWVADSGLLVPTPWLGGDLPDLRYTQSADVMYVVHPDYPPKEIRRTAVNVFTVTDFDSIEGPFRSINSDEAVIVAATAVLGDVTITSSADIFTSNAVGSLFYIETKNLGQVKPWVVGDRNVGIADLRRNDGKTYKAVNIPGMGMWHETGPRSPVHDAGRAWDGGGDTKTNGADTWSVGIEWEYQDSGYGVVRINSVPDARTALGTVVRRLPAQVVGGVGTAAGTWNLTGDGTTKVFAIAGAGYGTYTVTIGGVPTQSDPNSPTPGSGGGCVQVDSILPGGVRAGDVRVGDVLSLFDPVEQAAGEGVVTFSEVRLSRLWRIVTRDGVTLVCSDTAPIPVRQGDYLLPAELKGHEVPVMVSGLVAWDTVESVDDAGMGEVQHITVGDRCFWAGETDAGFLLHHNAKYYDKFPP